MTGTLEYTEEWQTLAWKEIERNVFRLQQRIYQAASRGDGKRVHNLQRLLLSSYKREDVPNVACACAQWTC